jgi:hypothetical protein
MCVPNVTGVQVLTVRKQQIFVAEKKKDEDLQPCQRSLNCTYSV